MLFRSAVQPPAQTAPQFQQVETDPNKVPREVAPGIIYTPATGIHTIQEQETAPQMGREVVRQEPTDQGRMEMVGLNAPTVDVNQGTLPGIPMALDQVTPEEIPEQAAPEFTTVLDADTLKKTRLKPQSGFFKQLLNRDMADPADQQEVAQVLAQVAQELAQVVVQDVQALVRVVAQHVQVVVRELVIMLAHQGQLQLQYLDLEQI